MPRGYSGSARFEPRGSPRQRFARERPYACQLDPPRRSADTTTAHLQREDASAPQLPNETLPSFGPGGLDGPGPALLSGVVALAANDSRSLAEGLAESGSDRVPPVGREPDRQRLEPHMMAALEQGGTRLSIQHELAMREKLARQQP